MKIFRFIFGCILLVSLFFAQAPITKAEGGVGVSPSEVNLTILEGDRAQVTFRFSREFYSTQEKFDLLADDLKGITFPDGQTIILAPGEKAKDVRLVIDSSVFSFGEYDTTVRFQTNLDAAGDGALQVRLAVSALLGWRIVDVDDYADFLLANKPIEITAATISKDIVDGERFKIDFLSLNNSLNAVQPLSYRIDIMNSAGNLESSQLVGEGIALGPYGEKQFNVVLRASTTKEEKAIIKTFYNEVLIAEQELNYVVSHRGVEQYLVIVLQFIVILFVVWTVSVSQKKKLLP